MRSAFDVSVIVPTYQGAAYLHACMGSIAAQDLTGVEVLVNDDGSTDDTVEIARSYSREIEHLRVLQNESRLGAVANVNRCVELARGSWIKPVFQDDLIVPSCLATMRAARRRRVTVVASARHYRYEDGVPPWRREACEHLIDQGLHSRFGDGRLTAIQVAEVAAEMAAAHLPHLNFVGEPVAMLFDRKAAMRAGGFDTGYVQLWDYELIVRLAMHGGMVLVAEPLATFRVHEASETARNISDASFRFDVLDRLRLLTAYATSPAYRPVRTAAARQGRPLSLVAEAVGVADAAQVMLDQVPAGERAATAQLIEEVASALPRPVPDGWAGASAATNARVAMLLELSNEPDLTAVSPDPAPDVPVSDEPAPSPSPRWRRTASRLSRGLRTNQWWAHMLGPIVAFAYLQIGWRDVDPAEGVPRVLALVASAIALAGYGYVVNDACDLGADLLAGKPNAMARFTRPVRLAVIAGFALLGVLPWIVIRLDPPAMVALAAIYLIPLLYSAPPVRLKERLIGPLADAANAFGVPALFTIALFAPLGGSAGPEWLMVAGAVLWAFGFGLRAILLHQIDDLEGDRASGTTTLVIQRGERWAVRAMRRVLYPTELLGFALLTATVLTWSVGTVVVGVGCTLIFHALRLTGVIDRAYATTTIERGYWLYWYQIWPALLVSAGLVAEDPTNLVLTAFVVVLFWSRVRSALGILRTCVVAELRRPRFGRADGAGS